MQFWCWRSYWLTRSFSQLTNSCFVHVTQFSCLFCAMTQLIVERAIWRANNLEKNKMILQKLVFGVIYTTQTRLCTRPSRDVRISHLLNVQAEITSPRWKVGNDREHKSLHLFLITTYFHHQTYAESVSELHCHQIVD